jgi:hypothetical protein
MKAVLNAFEVLLAVILKVFNLEHRGIPFPRLACAGKSRLPDA